MNLKIELALTALVVLAALWMAARSKRPLLGLGGTYRGRALMTDNELEFFGRLVAALPEHYVFPQVAMSALLEPAASDKKRAHSDRVRIAQQRVDYVVCTRGCEIVAVVELDDRTHIATKDQLRDARLEQGGIRTVRFQSRQKPAPDAIRTMVLGTPIVQGAARGPATLSVVPGGAPARPPGPRDRTPQ